MEIDVRNRVGEVTGKLQVSDYVWATPFSDSLVHQVVVAQLANRRQGTHDTKTRSEVLYSGSKLRIQKHTGRARQGDRAAPQLRGGGIVHGPHPRSYRQRVPAKMRRQALRMVLSEQLRRDAVTMLDEFSLDTPRTRTVLELQEKLGLGAGTLLVTAQTDHAVVRSANNVRGFEVIPAPLLNPLAVFQAKHLVITRDAAQVVDETWGSRKSTPAAEAVVA